MRPSPDPKGLPQPGLGEAGSSIQPPILVAGPCQALGPSAAAHGMSKESQVVGRGSTTHRHGGVRPPRLHQANCTCLESRLLSDALRPEQLRGAESCFARTAPTSRSPPPRGRRRRWQRGGHWPHVPAAPAGVLSLVRRGGLGLAVGLACGLLGAARSPTPSSLGLCTVDGQPRPALSQTAQPSWVPVSARVEGRAEWTGLRVALGPRCSWLGP